jgi:hypothetical protein
MGQNKNKRKNKRMWIAARSSVSEHLKTLLDGLLAADSLKESCPCFGLLVMAEVQQHKSNACLTCPLVQCLPECPHALKRLSSSVDQ